jgi:putative addiction module component (TIGR02574 family)
VSSNLVEIARSLPFAERVELVDALWESLANEGYEPQLTTEQMAELDRRLEAHRRDPNSVVPWESIKAELLSKHSDRQ